MTTSAIGSYSKVNNKIGESLKKSEFVNFQGEPDKLEISKDKAVVDSTEKKGSKYTWAYVVGGLAAIAAIIVLVKKNKGAEAASELKSKAGAKLGNAEVPNVKNKPDVVAETINKQNLETKIEEKVETAPIVETAPPKWLLSEEEKAKITVRPSDKFKLRLWVEQSFVESNDINEVIEKIMGSVYSGNLSIDKKVAREVLPVLLKNEEALQIGGHYERFFTHLTDSNKDFAVTEVVPWLAKNFKKMGIKDHYNNNYYLTGLDSESLKYAKRLGETSAKLGLDHHSNFFGVIGQVFEKGESFIFNEAIPTVIQNRTKMLNPAGDAIDHLITMLTPKNIKRVFKNDLPAVLAHKNALKLDKNSGSYVVNILTAMDKNGKDFVLKEALPLVLKNAKKLKIEDAYDIQSILTEVTPKNKYKLQLIADNAEKLEIKGRFDAFFMIRDTPEQEIVELINKK